MGLCYSMAHFSNSTSNLLSNKLKSTSDMFLALFIGISVCMTTNILYEALNINNTDKITKFNTFTAIGISQYMISRSANPDTILSNGLRLGGTGMVIYCCRFQWNDLSTFWYLFCCFCVKFY